MPRVTVSLADSTLHKVDEEAHKTGLSRSEYVATAIDAYVSGSNQASITVHNLELELNKSQTEVMQLNRKISKLENQLAEKDKLIGSKSGELNQLESKMNPSESVLNQAHQDLAKLESAKGKG